ncbi:guanylate kinase [Cylindrobasidium torrendii FP15055 ss-10]|uniref:Guanylate kinase n=1 Tax=Cylindrobasidium torrendii FP15055 ss-10 TaxID=1314674 RepID=A0A0D7BIL1_9AGAR|nr:guanylate kinase [Cylindrobasidium torrendii FP15055 ss-10]
MADFFRPLLLFGPSGVGKSTLLKRLFAEFPDKFGFSVSHTTRKPRPGEADGKDYHFVTVDRFKDLIAEKAFIEWAEFSGNYYGTSFATVRAVQERGQRCILDIEIQGVKQIRETNLNPVYTFISPPSMTLLRERLQNRGTETEASVQKRLATAVKEIDYAKTAEKDFVIINDDFERAYSLFRSVALGEKVPADTLPALDD